LTVPGEHSNSRSFASRFRRSLAFSALLSFLCATAALVFAHTPSRTAKHRATKSPVLPLAPGARVVSLTPKPGWFTEPSIAVNPLDPKQVVAAFQDNAHVSYSNDGGQTWHLASGAAPANYLVSGDVSIVYDNQGHAILCYLAFDRLGATDYWAHNATRNGIFIRRSLDGGKTWEKNDVAVIQHPTAPGIPFEDKPYIVADDTAGPYAGNLYVGWTRFTLTDSTILFSRSIDDGKSWSRPITISTQPGLPRDDTGSVEGFDAAIGPDGTVYAVWSDGTHIVLATSTDGGRHFRASREIIPTAASYFKPKQVDRGDGFPQIAIDPRGGRRGGPLYVCWTDYRNGDIDVFVSTSLDRGRSWGPAVRVNNDPLHDGADQFMQWAAVDPATGDLYVVFYDRRADPANVKATITLARSANHGHSFENYAWTRTPFDPEDAFIGDYSGLAALNGCVYGAWTEQVSVRAASRGSRARQSSQDAHSIVRVGTAHFPVPGAPAQVCP
jgi:hypothetical protein